MTDAEKRSAWDRRVETGRAAGLLSFDTQLILWAADEIERLREDREALLSVVVCKLGNPDAWFIYDPYRLGWSWGKPYKTREAAVAAALKAARERLAEARKEVTNDAHT